MHAKISRREMLNKSMVTCLGASFVLAGSEEAALAAAIDEGRTRPATPPDDQSVASMPTGRIGDLTISRLIMGGNLIGGYAHARDLLYVSRLFKAYNTEKKIMETMQLAEANGINTVFLTPADLHYVGSYNRRFGGRMQSVCQVVPSLEEPERDIRDAFENGASTMYIQGNLGDRLVTSGRFDYIARVLELIRECGCPAGMGGHALEVIKQCEAAGIETDYYVKTLHPDTYWSAHPEENRHEFEVDNTRYGDHDRFHDNIFDLFPTRTIEYMKTIEKPWIAFKVMAAGAIRPREGMKFAFEGGADFVCVGMFDFQVNEDANAARDVLAGALKRQRAWIA